MSRYYVSTPGADEEIKTCYADNAADEFSKSYTPENETFWETFRVADADAVDAERAKKDGDESHLWSEYEIEVHPAEPACENAEHDWQTPHEIVGRDASCPGEYGHHGAGMYIDEVCMNCGCGRTIDTWATNPDTGRQGLESVTYEIGKYSLGEAS